MNMKKRIFAILLSAAMMFTLMPLAAFAEESETPAGTDPAASEWEHEGRIPKDVLLPNLWGEYGDTELQGMYCKGSEDDTYVSTIDVQYEGDAEGIWPTIYYYGEYEYVDEDGVTRTTEGFKREGADPSDETAYAYAYVDYEKFDSLKAGINDVYIMAFIPYKDPDTGELEYKEFYERQGVWIGIDRPVSVEFIPADGFTLSGSVGYNYLDEEDFYGKGNMFRVRIDEPLNPEVWTEEPDPKMTIEVDYKYVNTGGVEGFYEDGNPEWERFDMYDGFECYLKKGLNKDVELTYNSYVKGQDESTPLKFKVDINADKLGLYADKSYYSYTGKVIQPKFKVYDTDDKLVPAKEYTVSKATAKKLGWYTVTIKIKDAYKDKYNVSSITASYSIGPKKPALTRVNAGKKRLLVKWKKFKKSELKNIDMMVIELSTDKHFLNGVKKVKVSKSQLKKGKKIVKGLKKGKKYYVRAYTYKTVSQKGVKNKMQSPGSKVLTKKTK